MRNADLLFTAAAVSAAILSITLIAIAAFAF